MKGFKITPENVTTQNFQRCAAMLTSLIAESVVALNEIKEARPMAVTEHDAVLDDCIKVLIGIRHEK